MSAEPIIFGPTNPEIQSHTGESREVVDRRIEPRWPVDTTGINAVLLPDTEIPGARISNISRTGACLLVGTEIAPGSYVSFDLGNQKIYAEVRNCRAEGDGFAIGVLIKVVANIA